MAHDHVHEYNYCNDQDAPQIIQLAFIVVALFITVPAFFIGFVKLSKSRVVGIFKYIFYACGLCALVALLGFLTTIVLCHYDSNQQWLYISVSTSFIAYGLLLSHLPFLWLLRLFHTFNGSVYEKPIIFYAGMTLTFSLMIILAISAFALFTSYNGFYRHIAMVLGLIVVLSYLLVYLLILVVFLSSFYRLVTNRVATIHFESPQTLRRKTQNINLNSQEQVFVDYISKYLILGISSFLSTLTVIVIACLYYALILHGGDAQILKSAIIVDVVNNIVCIYLQCNHAGTIYGKMCGYCNYAITTAVERSASDKISTRTYSFYSTRFGTSKNRLSNINEEDQEELLDDLDDL